MSGLTPEERQALSQAVTAGYDPLSHTLDGTLLVAAVERILARHATSDAERLDKVRALLSEEHESPVDLIHERCAAGGAGPGRECLACAAAGRAWVIGVEQRAGRPPRHPRPRARHGPRRRGWERGGGVSEIRARWSRRASGGTGGRDEAQSRSDRILVRPGGVLAGNHSRGIHQEDA